MSKRSRRERRMAEMMSDDGPYLGRGYRARSSGYMGYDCWNTDGWTSSRDELTEREIENAKGSPYPRDLLASVLNLASAAASQVIVAEGYQVRVVNRDGSDVLKYYSGLLDRKRINLHVVDEIVVLAYVG